VLYDQTQQKYLTSNLRADTASVHSSFKHIYMTQ